MATAEILQGVLDGLSSEIVGGVTSQPGQPVTAHIIPPLDSLDVTEALTGDVDITWVAKDVLFGNNDLQPDFAAAALNAATTGAQPAGISPLSGSLVQLPGVPGNLGQLKGTLPMAVATRVPVTAQVTWEVLDAEGNALPGSEFDAPGGLTGIEVSVVFVPATTELTTANPVPAPTRRQLRATVQLTAAGVTVGPRVLPAIPVLVPVIPIPTILAAFLHSNFQARDGDDDGAALIVVPSNSPLASAAQLQSTLNTLQSTLSGLSGLAGFAGMVLGISELTGALSAHKSANVQFRATDQIKNLNSITLIQNSWYENDIEAEDELSSLVLLGRDGRAVEFFKHRDFKGRSFTLTTGATFFALVRSLHASSPTVEGGTITNPSENLGDELSSLRFT